MQCKKCGRDNDADSKFCKECGQKLEQAPESSAPTEHIKVGELIYTAYKHKEAGRIEDAILACQGALALNDSSAPAHALLASLYELKGDIASAIHEYEKVVVLNPGNAADRRKLEDLRVGRIAPRPPVRASTVSRLESLSSYAPYGAAAAVFVIILVVGLMLIRGSAGKTGPDMAGQPPTPTAQGGVPQATGPARPYMPSRYPEEQPFGPVQQPYPDQGQVQQPQTPSPAAPTEPAQNAASDSARQAGPAAPASRPQQAPSSGSRPSGQAPPAQPSASKEPPVIVPVIEPEKPSPTRQASPPAPKPQPVITISASRPASDPEERALQAQRAGRYQEAISAYREALSQTNDAGRMYQQIALCYQRLGQHDMAIDNYNRAIRSYRDQLAAGRDAAEVQRNIRSCEAGIQVSRSQSR